MPSKGFTVDTTNRNDVISFYQAVFKASEGFEERAMWKDHPATTYAVDNSVAYTYNDVNSEFPLIKGNGQRASGELNLSFVKDVERRVNFYRALAGVPATASLMDSDTAKNTSTIEATSGVSPAYEPPLTTTKADAAQQSAYLISRTAIDKYADGTSHYGTIHEQRLAVIPGLSAWNKEAWNAHRQSNITRGYYGPRAIDKYMSEDQAGTDSVGVPKENTDVGHRRKILLIRATNFATGDTPPEYVQGRSPELREPANALYHIQRPSEYSDAAARFVAFPNSGFFPAPCNTPFWSLTYPGATTTFTGATVSMTDSGGNPVSISGPYFSTTLTNNVHERTISWKVLDANATATSITTDRTYNVTVSGINNAGTPTSYSYSVTLINPEIVTSPQTLTGSNTPPAGGSAAYLLTPPDSTDSIQVNSFQASATTWTENAEVATTTSIIDQTYGNYAFVSPMSFSAGSPVAALQGARSFRLTHPVRYDAAANGVPEEIFELGRDILPSPTLTSNLQFSYRRGLMTTSSTMVVEISSNNGANWQTLGTSIVGHLTGSGSPEGSAQSWSATLPASTVPYRIRFRLYKSGTGSTFNHSDASTANAATGIFLDNITTTNTTTLELKKANEVATSTTKFTLNNTSAGVALTNGSPLHLRTRAKLGGNWMNYGPSKIVTPTSSPTTGFAGWTAYDYPELTGGFGGDHNGDGVANAVEFAFHLNPLQANVSSDTVTRSADTISIERSIPSQRAGLTYKAEWSDTLLPGSWSQVDVSVTFPSGKVVATAPVGPAGKRFIRWKFDE